ncbi:MAG: hypothetical protein VX563_04470, partial [Planctomycetota bacterium]|nr:hypothetical protein [Planctomycetota bacterium]
MCRRRVILGIMAGGAQAGTVPGHRMRHGRAPARPSARVPRRAGRPATWAAAAAARAPDAPGARRRRRSWEDVRKDDEWLRRRRAELKGLKISELRTLLSAHGASAADVLAARKKDSLLMALMQREVAAEVRGRLEVLRAARRRRRRLDDSGAPLLYAGEEAPDAPERGLSLLSFSEQVAMLHEATKVARAEQRKALLGDGDDDDGGGGGGGGGAADPSSRSEPWDALDAIDVVDGFAACIKRKYQTATKHRTLYAEKRDELRGDRDLKVIVDLDPDEGDMRVWVVRTRANRAGRGREV